MYMYMHVNCDVSICRMANFEGLSTTANTGMSESGGGSGLNYFSDRFFDQSVTWRDISWLKSISRLPIVVKGVLTGERPGIILMSAR